MKAWKTLAGRLPRASLAARGDDAVLGSWSGIGRSLMARCQHLWEEKAGGFPEKLSIQDLLGMSLPLSPETTRRFWRSPALKPEDVLEILLGFEPNTSRSKVEFLWKLFRWASDQGPDFCHLPRSYDTMISMLVREHMFGEAQTLVFHAESQGVLSSGGSSDACAEIVRGYAEASDMDRSVASYHQARERGIPLSALCYRTLLKLLIRKGNAGLVLEVYKDMIGAGIGLCCKDDFVDFVVRELTKKGKILEALVSLRQARVLGIKASSASLTLISEGYCVKKDFDDMFNFMEEWGHIPRVGSCNKIVSCLCRNLGTEEAWLFAQRMEALGFVPDATTFAILISQGCRERKLRNAFVYLSECFRRNITPHVHAYNALISGAFVQGLHSCTKDVYDDIVERGLQPDIGTFKVMLAGYCKYRQFDKVKSVTDKMRNYGVIFTDSTDDAITKSFTVLGLDKLGVKLKRVNSFGQQQKAEFFDSLGNGLYLETDIEEYDRLLRETLDGAMLPNFDSIVLDKCGCDDIESALKAKEEALQWGHNFSLSVYTEILKCLFKHPSHMEEVIILLEDMPELLDQLDHDNLNLLIQAISRSGRSAIAKSILDEALKKEKLVQSETFATLIRGFCGEEIIDGIQECITLALRGMWEPSLEDLNALGCFLCKWGMIKELLELFAGISVKYPGLISDFCYILFRQLCATGHLDVCCLLMEEVLQADLTLDHAAYISLIKGYLVHLKFVEALGIFDILLEKDITDDNVHQIAISLLIKFGRFEKLFQMKHYLGSKSETLVGRELTDGSTLNSLMQRYCQEGIHSKVCEVLCSILKMSVDLSLSSYRKLVCHLCVHGHVNRARHLQKLVQSRNKSESLVLYNLLLYYLFRSGNNLLVCDLLIEMRDKALVMDQTTYNFLICGFHKSGNFSQSMAAFHDMISRGLQPSNRSLRIIVSLVCGNDKIEDIPELASLILHSKWKYGTVVQNGLIGSLLSCGRFNDAEILLGQMQEKSLVCNRFDYDFLIKEFCLHGRTGKALELLNVMLKKGGFPSEASYSFVIIGLCRHKSFDLALDFHAEMRHRGLVPSMEALDAIVSGLCDKARCVGDANCLEATFPLPPTPKNEMRINALDRHSEGDNNLDNASKLLDEMQGFGCSPNFETHWSLIRNLGTSDGKDDEGCTSFLSQLLSRRGLPSKKSATPRALHYALWPS